MPVPADHTAFAVWGDSVYVFGGFTNALASHRVWRFTSTTSKWAEMVRMPRARGGLAGAVIGDRFYAVGGASSALQRFPSVLRVLDVYDFRTNTWRTGPRMAFARQHHSAAAVGGKFYVVGGRSNRSLALPHLERFDPVRGRWQQLEPLPLGSGGLEAVTWRNRLLVLGGGDDVRDDGWVTPATWSYSPAENRWTRLGDMVVPRHGFGATISDGRLVRPRRLAVRPLRPHAGRRVGRARVALDNFLASPQLDPGDSSSNRGGRRSRCRVRRNPSHP